MNERVVTSLITETYGRKYHTVIEFSDGAQVEAIGSSAAEAEKRAFKATRDDMNKVLVSKPASPR